MSAATKCDWCGAVGEQDSPDLADWIEVSWPGRGSRHGGVRADYCTAACAVNGIEKARDEDAETLLALNDDGDEDL